MQYTEIENIVESYLESQTLSPTQLPRSPLRFGEGANLDQCQKDEVLAKVRAREALKAIKCGPWQEGRILSTRGTLYLVSDTYRAVKISPWIPKPSKVEIVEASTYLTVGITSDFGPTEIMVADYNYFSTNRDSTVKDTIYERGVNGLRSFALGNQNNGAGIDSFRKYIDVETPNLTERFYLTLVNAVNERRSQKTLPQDLRNLSESIIDQMPNSLQEKGVLEGDELTDWVRQIQGHPLIWHTKQLKHDLVKLYLLRRK